MTVVGLESDLVLPEDSRWKIIHRGEDYTYPKSGKITTRYVCECIWGKTKLVHRSHLKNGSSKSCGCLNREISSAEQGTGYVHTRAYAAWVGMKGRVNSPSEKNSTYRDVEICQTWLDSFLNFYEDLGDCPEGFELERVINSKGYVPGNCVWANELRQAQNKGDYKSNTSGYKGVTWSKEHEKWRVYLSRNKIKYEGGLFVSIEDAIMARKNLEQLYPMEPI